MAGTGITHDANKNSLLTSVKNDAPKPPIPKPRNPDRNKKLIQTESMLSEKFKKSNQTEQVAIEKPKKLVDPPVKKTSKMSTKPNPSVQSPSTDQAKSVPQTVIEEIINSENIEIPVKLTNEIIKQDDITAIIISENIREDIVACVKAEENSEIDELSPLHIEETSDTQQAEITTNTNKQDHNNCLENADMTASMNAKTRITTEEEAKAALAERRRLAREEAERQALAEKLRQEQEEERQHQEEEQLKKLAEEQRKAEEERLAQVNIIFKSHFDLGSTSAFFLNFNTLYRVCHKQY